MYGQSRDPVFAQHHTGAELLRRFSYVGVCQAPWGGKSPTLHPAMHEHIQRIEEEDEEGEEEEEEEEGEEEEKQGSSGKPGIVHPFGISLTNAEMHSLHGCLT